MILRISPTVLGSTPFSSFTASVALESIWWTDLRANFCEFCIVQKFYSTSTFVSVIKLCMKIPD